MSNVSFLNPMPRVVAHRGDSANYPENTLPAFLSAVEMGIDVVETDVHLTKDGQIIIWHDDTLERNTDGVGRIEDHSVEELKKYDAGYTFTKDGGLSFPFRGKGIQLCTLDEALKACPEERFNIDLKTNDVKIVDSYLKVIKENRAEGRVCTASFHLDNLKAVRKKAPELLTSVSTLEVLPLLFGQKLHLLPKKFDRKIVFQVPQAQWGIKVITKGFVEAMHRRGAVIMVWTINDEETMRRLFELGVDSVMTDNPSLLIKVSKALGLR